MNQITKTSKPTIIIENEKQIEGRKIQKPKK